CVEGPGGGGGGRRGEGPPPGGVCCGAVRDEGPLQRGLAGVPARRAVRRGVSAVDRHRPVTLVRRPALADRALHDWHGPHHLLLRLLGPGDRPNGPVTKPNGHRPRSRSWFANSPVLSAPPRRT